MSATTVSPWPAALAASLVGAGAEVAAWVPDKRLIPVAAAFEASGVPLHTLAREEECVGFASGYRAAGGLPVVLCQCSGLGNALNALASLALPYGLGFPCVVSMRGTLGEGNPAQVPLGRASVALLGSLGIQAFSLRTATDAAVVGAGAGRLAYEARQVAAIVLEPELDGR